MALQGIDVASYQGALDLGNINYDFVLIKATEGTGYVNPDCDAKYQAAKASGKLRGVYMFVDHGGDPEAEADYFVDNCQGYIGEAVLAVDWEGSFVSDTDYLHRILKRIESRAGVKPLVYMSQWVENAYDWSAVVADDFGLWAARYSDYEIDNDYDMSGAGSPPTLTHWPFNALWQWTSRGHLSGYAGDLDCDIFYGDQTTWNAYAALPAAPPAPASAPVPVTVDVKPNDNDGTVPVSQPSPPITPVAAAATPATEPAPSMTPAVAVKNSPKVKGVRTAFQTVVGGLLTYTVALLADPHVQALVAGGIQNYVGPALLGLGLSSGLVSFIVNLLEDRVTGKTA